MRIVRFMLATLLLAALVAVIGVTITLWWFSRNLPRIETLADYRPPLATRVFNLNGELLAEYADEHRILVPFEAIPKRLIDAFLAAEDQQFYEHPGINPARIIAAAIANLKAGHAVQGGSTITQQVAKNFFLSPKKTLARKIREAILAWKIEQRFSKDEILWLYLNQIYLGRGSYGVASAAWRYFGKRLDELSLAECALLAGLPKAPSKYAPHANPKAALLRRNTVLRLMAEAGFISEEEAKQAMREPIKVVPLPRPKLKGAYARKVYQMLVDRFGVEAVRKGGLFVLVPYDPKAQEAAEEALRKGVIAIEERTPYRVPEHLPPEQWAERLAAMAKALGNPPKPLSPDRPIPALVEKVEPDALLVNDGLRRWRVPKPSWRWQRPEGGIRRPLRWLAGDIVWIRADAQGKVRLTQRTDLQAALYALDLVRGTALARVGGFEDRIEGFDRVSQARRQPGSALKPFLYATALDHGWTPASLVLDAPVVFDEPEQGDFWRPENYEGRFAGPVTLRNALEHSRNLASIRLLMDLGVGIYVDALESNYAFRRRFPRELSLALGSAEVSLEELVESYAVFAKGGLRWQPVWIAKVEDRNGRTLLRATAGFRCTACHAEPPIAASDTMKPAERTLDATTAFLITNMMKGVIERGTGRAARRLGRPAAGKTGTTNDQVDAWFVGFTPQRLTGVWVGRDRPSTIGPHETGARAALPIWLAAMQAFHEGLPVKDFPVPEGIEWVPIDQKTGKLPTPESEDVVLEAFRVGTAPTDASSE